MFLFFYRLDKYGRYSSSNRLVALMGDTETKVMSAKQSSSSSMMRKKLKDISMLGEGCVDSGTVHC